MEMITKIVALLIELLRLAGTIADGPTRGRHFEARGRHRRNDKARRR